jgi:hypothetical protein
MELCQRDRPRFASLFNGWLLGDRIRRLILVKACSLGLKTDHFGGREEASLRPRQ